MKRIARTHSRVFPPVRLFLEDVEGLVEILHEVADEIKIVAGEYSLESVDELTQIPHQHLTNLELHTRQPYIQLDFSPSSTRVYIAEYTTLARGVADKICTLLKSRRRTIACAISSWAFGAIIMVGIMALMFILSILIDRGMILDRDWLLFVAGIGGLVFVTWFWWSDRIRFKRHSLIILKKKGEQDSFWKRNQDEVVVAIVAAIISSLLTLAVQALIE